MHIRSFRIALAGPALVALLAGLAAAEAQTQSAFNRISAFPVVENMPAGADRNTETAPEIIAASADGRTLIYTDSPQGVVGLIDIADPRSPQPLGQIKMPGEPTSVAVAGPTAFVAVNTSKSYTEPGGALVAVDIKARTAGATCDLGGQPDSIAVAPDQSFIAVAIENERDEDRNDGVIPQMPAGNLTLVPLKGGRPDCAAKTVVSLAGLAAVAGSDPEPEFVDINGRGEVVVTLQENNHIAIVNGRTGAVIRHFSAGTADLENVDTRHDGALRFDEKLTAQRREPDAVKWLDDNRFAIANEGDYEGGARGFTVFGKDGTVLYESGAQFEHQVAMHGHYPDKRSGKKGAEPEGLEVGTFAGTTYLFVASERGSAIGVYRVGAGAPAFAQMLPSGIAPEGLLAIPSRNLFVTANEGDLIEDGGVRAHVMIYELQNGEPAYPQIVSGLDAAGRPIGWGALSGLAADPSRPGILYAVSDSFYGNEPAIFTIDATRTPARITEKRIVTRGGQPAQKLDLEGIAIAPGGGFWLASEGRTDRLIPHALYRVDAKGAIQQEIAFPAELLAVEKRFGAEGVTLVGEGDAATLWIAIQREWADDAAGTVKLVSYNIASKAWGYVNYPLEPKGKGWVGLSEITAHGDHVYIIERDNQIGAAAKLKRLFRVAIAELTPAKLGAPAPTVTKHEARDFLADLTRPNGFVVDKIEGFAIDASGVGYAVTDNDGVDDSSGETFFFATGRMM